MAKYFCVGATPRGCPIPCGCPLTGQARGPAPTTLYWVSVYPNWVNKYIHAYIVFFTMKSMKYMKKNFMSFMYFMVKSSYQG